MRRRTIGLFDCMMSSRSAVLRLAKCRFFRFHHAFARCACAQQLLIGHNEWEVSSGGNLPESAACAVLQLRRRPRGVRGARALQLQLALRAVRLQISAFR